MQFFLANLYSERLSGSDETSTAPAVDSAPDNAAVADETRQSSTLLTLSGSR